MKRFVTMLALLVGGCWSPTSILSDRTDPSRAGFGNQTIAVEPRGADTVNPDPRGPGGSLVVTEEIRGTWTFTCPATVTQLERKTAEYDQFSLYVGRPGATDKPFVVITVTKDRRTIAPADPAMYTISDQRQYALNGNIAEQWAGTTSDGAGFCEVIARRIGDANGDVCHAMAVSRNEEQRKMALEILGSITWKAAR